MGDYGLNYFPWDTSVVVGSTTDAVLTTLLSTLTTSMQDAVMKL